MLKVTFVVFILAGLSRATCPDGLNATGTLDQVDGESRRFLAPDVSNIRVSIEATAPTIDEATTAGEALVDKVTERLQGQEVTSIRSSDLDWDATYPKDENDYEDTSAEPEEFTYSQKLDIVTTPNNSATIVKAVSGDAGITVDNVVNYVSYSKQIQEMDEMRTEAFENAMKRATVSARDAGGRVGSLLSVSDSSSLDYIPDMDYADDPDGEVSVTVYVDAELCL